MDAKIRERAHQLEIQMRTVPPTPAINHLCVTVARLEAELAKVTEERDRLRQGTDAQVTG